jgi:hypothetical protein
MFKIRSVKRFCEELQYQGMRALMKAGLVVIDNVILTKLDVVSFTL